MDSCDMEAPTTTLVYSTKYARVALGIDKVRDWLTWSIINMFLGMGGGLLPLIFSLICRSKKRHDDLSGARTMSILALVFNIVVTIGGILCWIVLIAKITVFAEYISTTNQTIIDYLNLTLDDKYFLIYT